MTTATATTRRRPETAAPKGTWAGDWLHDLHAHLAAAGVPVAEMTRDAYGKTYGYPALFELDAFHERTPEKVAAVDALLDERRGALDRLRTGDYAALSEYRRAEAALDAAQYMPTPARRELDTLAEGGEVTPTAEGIEIDALEGRWAMSLADAMELATSLTALVTLGLQVGNFESANTRMESAYGDVTRTATGLEVETPSGIRRLRDLEALELAVMLCTAVHHQLFEKEN